MTEQTLAQLVRAKYPGDYDDLTDQDLEAAWRAKYPGDYDDVPSTPSSATPRADASRAIVLPKPGTEVPPTPTAREQADTRPAKYINEMLRNVPGDLLEQSKNLATGTYDLLSVMAKATGEIGYGTGSFIREAIGLEPNAGVGTENLRALARVPGAIVSHYAQYADPDFRAERVREHPVGLAIDMAPVSAALKVGVPATADIAKAGASAAVRVARKAPERVADTLYGAAKLSPVGVFKGVTGKGPVSRARNVIEQMRSAPTETPAAGAAPAPPAAPRASSPAAPAPSIVGATPESRPALPGRRGPSPQMIQNELGIQARRQQVTLTEPQYKAATALVSQGKSPAEAVTQVARQPPVPPAPATATAAAPPAAPVKATAKGRGSKAARLTADEADEYLRLMEKGLSHEEATQFLIDQRNLLKRLGTQSPETVRERVARRLSRDNRTASEEP